MRFDHVGIATEDASSLASLYTDLCDLEVVHREHFDGMQVVFLDIGGGFFELLEPTDDGAIARYLDQHGPGLHHAALETDDIEEALGRADDLGVECIDEEPRPGAWGHTVAFLHPQDTGGVLLEFVEH